MIVEDPYLRLSLEKRPEFLLRLEELAHRYSLEERPALVLQARPAPEAVLPGDLTSDPKTVSRFTSGIQTSNGWWQGFRSRIGESGCFRGVVSLPTYGDVSWASEMHHDGHFVAGVWRFPEEVHRGNQAVLVIPNFFANAFSDFFALIANTLSGVNGKPLQYEVTATLLNAVKLHYGGDEFTSHLRITGRPTTLRHVQWPIKVAEVGTPEWSATGKATGASLKYAFAAFDA